ncbi:MAG: UDP-N-acetylmuramate dehydrogenase [Betaproteobacteria bacterium]|nr:UDP-N-acetylmuramate dehydrogenase [Betaproteobacteria bacterium]
MDRTEAVAQPPQRPGLLRGVLREHESMARHVSWRAGGAAWRVYAPADLADLQAFLASLAADEPLCFVGLGSNLLVRDGGFRGTMVLMHHTRGEMRLEGGVLYAEAGLAAPKVARYAATRGLEGAEFLAGVPGTVGGALAMNAGCYGSETWDHVLRVQTIARDGTLRERARSEYDIGYRHCARKPVAGDTAEEWFVGAWFRFRAGDASRARQTIKELLAKRIAAQPLELPNAGSVFRNPPGDHAARLVDACGLKGHAVGGAQISRKHANFIVNPLRTATAADIEALIAHAQAAVKARFGIELVPEVRVVGEPAAGASAAAPEGAA